MSSDEIRERTQKVWDRFYNWSAIWERSACCPNVTSRIAFIFLSKLYRQMYAGTGISSDSARRKKSQAMGALDGAAMQAALPGEADAGAGVSKVGTGVPGPRVSSGPDPAGRSAAYGSGELNASLASERNRRHPRTIGFVVEARCSSASWAGQCADHCRGTTAERVVLREGSRIPGPPKDSAEAIRACRSTLVSAVAWPKKASELA